MTPTFAHIVLTRFNVRFGITGKTPSTSHDWLLPRLKLFETFCLPSMEAQLVPHQWLLLCDANTPPDVQERLNSYEACTPIWVEGVLSDQRIARLVSERLRPSATHLITTRLDNDDAIADDFLLRVQNAFAGQDSTYLNFPFGYQWQDGKLYHSVQLANPFLSYVERVRQSVRTPRVTTVYSGQHSFLRTIAPVQQLWAPPMWVQVLHGGNVANEMCGIRRFWSRPPSQFSGLALSHDQWLPRIVDLAKSIGYLAVLPWLKRHNLVARWRRVLLR